MSQLVLYSQQLVRNNKFALLSTYEWDYTGTWVKSAGLITKSSGSGTLTQSSVFTIGVKYELKYTISGGSATGTVTVSDGVNSLSVESANGSYTIEFTASGNDLIFTTNSTFLAAISNVSVLAMPTLFKLDIDSQIPFKFSREDIFEVGKRKAPRTGSFVIKGTHEVNNAFRQIYLINANSIFNQNIKTKCTLISEGIEFFYGTLCLDDIVEKINNTNGITDIEYNVSIVENVTDIYAILGEKTVRDLDFSLYDHSFDVERITSSWLGDITNNGSPDNNTITSNTFTVSTQTSVTVGGLNRIKFKFTANHNFAVGQEVYVSPNGTQCNITGGGSYLFHQKVHSITAADEIVLECSDPCSAYAASSPSNASTVSDQMFSGYGYYYPCVDNGTYVKNIFAPPFGDGLFEVGQTYIIKYFSTGDDFTNIGALSNSTGTIFTATGTTPTTWTSGSLIAKFRDTSLAIGTDPLNSKFGSNFSVVETNDSVWEAYDFIPYLFIREILLKCFELANLEYDCDVFDTKIFRSLIIPMNDPNTLIEGATLQMNEWTPPMKLKDILNSVLNIFNLSMEQKGRVLTFKNRGSYFDNPPIDWGDKIDISKPIKLTMLNKDGAKIYHFSYAKSSDYINTNFSETYGAVQNTSGLVNIVDRTYGDYLVDLVTDYRDAASDVSILFEPSILAGGSHEFIDGIYGESTALFPMHFSASKTLGDIKRTYTPKILIASPRWNYTQSSNAIPMNLNFISQTTTSLKNSWYYGFASHFDNPFQVVPNHDINFYSPLAVYFAEFVDCLKLFNYTIDLNDSGYSDATLYTKYWGRYLDQITNINSKKVSGVLKLSLIDIYSLDFSIPIIIGDLKLKLILIDDWYLDSDGLCNVEFLITK